MTNPTNQTYVRVPLAAFDQLASVLSDIDWAHANLTTAYTIKEKVAQGHQLIEQTLGDNANLIYAEDN